MMGPNQNAMSNNYNLDVKMEEITVNMTCLSYLLVIRELAALIGLSMALFRIDKKGKRLKKIT